LLFLALAAEEHTGNDPNAEGDAHGQEGMLSDGLPAIIDRLVQPVVNLVDPLALLLSENLRRAPNVFAPSLILFSHVSCELARFR
jgi:hypothetical protein